MEAATKKRTLAPVEIVLIILAVLAAPVPRIRKSIDRLFSLCSPRLFLVLLCLVCITRQPIEEFAEAGKQMGQFLHRLYEIVT